ncbi:MAG: GAF domain-containing sensor histidine kinase, partial [Pseudomonadota bacterium]
ETTQWIHASCGLDAASGAREGSFCNHALAQGDVFIVEDALNDPRFADHPLVIGPPHIRFYAGTPLVARHGEHIGSLCVIGPSPRMVSQGEAMALKRLARIALRAIKQRSALSFAERSIERIESEVARRSRMAAGYAHDIRTPLNAIGGYAELLLMAPEDAAADRSRLAAIKTSVDALDELTERFMTANAAAGGVLTAHVRRAKLRDLVLDVMNFVRESAARRDVEIMCDSADNASIETDIVMMKQFLANALSNAVKYTRAGTTVRVSIAKTEDFGARITVADAGKGLTADEFAIATGGETPSIALSDSKKDSFGLGLCLMHDLAMRLDGTLKIESGHHGTTIEARFPPQLAAA